MLRIMALNGFQHDIKVIEKLGSAFMGIKASALNVYNLCLRRESSSSQSENTKQSRHNVKQDILTYKISGPMWHLIIKKLRINVCVRFR